MAKHFYVPGAKRWLRHTGNNDVRAHRPPEGWMATAEVLDYHPTTGNKLKKAQWWICETYVGED